MKDEIDYKTAYETAMIGFKMQMQEIERLNNIINKAIEYIEHEWFKREQIGIAPLQFSYEELQHILDILKGEDND